MTHTHKNRLLSWAKLSKYSLYLVFLIGVTNSSAQVEEFDELPVGTYIQRSKKLNIKQKYKTIYLQDVIEQGLRQNYDQELRNYNQSLLDLNWRDTYQAFWYPKVTMNLTTSGHKLGLLSDGKGSANDDHPSGTASINFGDYTVFNWGKDHLQFLIDRTTYTRNIENLTEEKRELKFNLIIQFFQTFLAHEIEAAYRYQLRQASFLYRTNREKLALKKISTHEYYQSRNEYLRAQQEFRESKLNRDTEDENLSVLMSDPVGTKYKIASPLVYKRLKITISDAIKLSQLHNPQILDANTEIANARKQYELSLKENLPLPKISMNLGAYTKTFGGSQNETIYETSSGTSDIELVATINATWTIFGTDGFMNSRKKEKSLINRHMAFTKLRQARHQSSSNVEAFYRRIINLEDMHTILEARVPSTQKAYEVIVDKYYKRKTSYINVHDSLTDLTESKVNYAQIKFEHAKAKIEMARNMGIDDLPGESFENLTIETKSFKGKGKNK